jgi:hypothetical protein
LTPLDPCWLRLWPPVSAMALASAASSGQSFFAKCLPRPRFLGPGSSSSSVHLCLSSLSLGSSKSSSPREGLSVSNEVVLEMDMYLESVSSEPSSLFEVDGFDEISVLPASSPTSSVSFPSQVSSPTSPASQPSSLAFVGSFDEPESLSVT